MNEQAKAHVNALLNKWDLEQDAKAQILATSVSATGIASLEAEIATMRKLYRELKEVVDIHG